MTATRPLCDVCTTRVDDGIAVTELQTKTATEIVCALCETIADYRPTETVVALAGSGPFGRSMAELGVRFCDTPSAY